VDRSLCELARSSPTASGRCHNIHDFAREVRRRRDPRRAQGIAYFNYITRIADALGVERVSSRHGARGSTKMSRKLPAFLLVLCSAPCLGAREESDDRSHLWKRVIRTLSVPATLGSDGSPSFFFPSSTEGRPRGSRPRAEWQSCIVVPRGGPSPSEAGVDEREYTRRTRFGVPDYHWSPDEPVFSLPALEILVHRSLREPPPSRSRRAGS
jgi:hypothetical protein